MVGLFLQSFAQNSIAKEWNEELLEAIRNDFARPTVHARNLFHISAAMYDAWAVYEPDADTYFLNKNVHGFKISFGPIPTPIDVKAAQEKAISYAAYRLIDHRFQNAPFYNLIKNSIDFQMEQLGYNIENTSLDYGCGSAELGNYIAKSIIDFGMQDGANELDQYVNRYYEPINPPLKVEDSGNPSIVDLNRWQPLEFSVFVDQSGNPTGNNVPEFLSPEWGSVIPFSLKESDASVYQRNDFDYVVYHDPGPPAYLEDSDSSGITNPYKWGNALVAIWSSHLDPSDTTQWDISPGALGNISNYPSNIEELPNFYNLLEGGDIGQGHELNPFTGMPYEPNVVKRSDYARILAEFWADGPDSETPPGHWFTILNKVNEHPDLEKKFMGTGPELDDLEWDIKSYFILGGAMHDVAITAWGIKGWYDYVRPVSAIRGMAEFGQGSDPNLPSYHVNGLPLIPGWIELIESGDPLQGSSGQHTGKIKVKAWRGPNYIINPAIDVAGVGWIRAEDWWPYQRPSFVTPPFAGYVSGHSTYSRAAAEVLTAMTGDPFFPGGVGEFECIQNQFLVFEDGPTEDITLQWATYRDASDQCSLSRIWGGIHPPVDDIPGRLIGEKIGKEAFNFALPYFSKEPDVPLSITSNFYPNPTNCGVTIEYQHSGDLGIEVYQLHGKLILEQILNFRDGKAFLSLSKYGSGIFVFVIRDIEGKVAYQEKVVVVE